MERDGRETGTQGGDGGDEGARHLGARAYLLTWIALLVLTTLSFGTSLIKLGTLNLIVALAIAITKTLLVLSIFMHLIEQRFVQRLAIVFAAMLLVLLIAGMVADVSFRHTFPQTGLPAATQQPRPEAPPE